MNMHVLKKLSAGLAVAAGLLGGGAANAGVVCSSCQYNDLGPTVNTANVFGTYNPLNNDTGGVTHAGLGNGPFSDWFVFTISPAGLVQGSATFTFSNLLNSFRGELFGVSASTCAAFTNGTLSNCTSVTLDGNPALYDSGVLSGAQFLTPLMLLGGTYALHVSGNSLNSAQGNTMGLTLSTTRYLPEPGSLALAALALLGAGMATRRRS